MGKEKNKKNIIPVKNYIKLLILIVVTIFCSFLLRNWYMGRVNYELNIPVIAETVLRKISNEEVYNYVHENENAIIYMGVASDKNCRAFEKEFNKVIKDRSLEDKITYLNITDVKDKNAFIEEFNTNYGISLQGYPSLIIFSEGKVKSVYSVKTGYKLNISAIIKFLDENGVDSAEL